MESASNPKSDYDTDVDATTQLAALRSNVLKDGDLGARNEKLVGTFLKETVGELMPLDSTAEANEVLQRIIRRIRFHLAQYGVGGLQTDRRRSSSRGRPQSITRRRSLVQIGSKMVSRP